MTCWAASITSASASIAKAELCRIRGGCPWGSRHILFYGARELRLMASWDRLCAGGRAMALTVLHRLAGLAAAAVIFCGGGALAQTYQANLGPMPLDAATNKNMLGRGEATA